MLMIHYTEYRASINEFYVTILENAGFVEQYFEAINL
jgi:hypothetical protein